MSDTTLTNPPIQSATPDGAQIQVESMKRLRGDPSSYASSPVISVLVGPQLKLFNVHIKLFANESLRIRDWYEQRTQNEQNFSTMKLPDQPDSFMIIYDVLALARAWHTASNLKMRNAKNATVDRIRKIVAVAKTEITRSDYHRDGELVRTMILELVQIKSHGGNGLSDFLFDRFAFDMAHAATLITGNPPRLVPAIQNIFDKAPKSVSTVFTQYLQAQADRALGRSQDPALKFGCVYHEHLTTDDRNECIAAQGQALPPSSQSLALFTPRPAPWTPVFGRAARDTVEESPSGGVQNGLLTFPPFPAFGVSTAPHIFSHASMLASATPQPSQQQISPVTSAQSNAVHSITRDIPVSVAGSGVNTLTTHNMPTPTPATNSGGNGANAYAAYFTLQAPPNAQ